MMFAATIALFFAVLHFPSYFARCVRRDDFKGNNGTLASHGAYVFLCSIHAVAEETKKEADEARISLCIRE
jgi:hypothetical protein